jgi:hypothetical protein
MPSNRDRDALMSAIKQGFDGIDLDDLTDNDLQNLAACLQSLSVAKNADYGPGTTRLGPKKFSTNRAGVTRVTSPAAGRGMSEGRRQTLLGHTPFGKSAAARRR